MKETTHSFFIVGDHIKGSFSSSNWRHFFYYRSPRIYYTQCIRTYCSLASYFIRYACNSIHLQSVLFVLHLIVIEIVKTHNWRYLSLNVIQPIFKKKRKEKMIIIIRVINKYIKRILTAMKMEWRKGTKKNKSHSFI